MKENRYPCQITNWPHLAEGNLEGQRTPLRKQFKMFLKRRLSMERKRQLKRLYTKWITRSKPVLPPAQPSAKPAGIIQTSELMLLRSKDKAAATLQPSAPVRERFEEQTAGGLQRGDLVRVRSEEEIRAMLNNWGEFRGCSFMSGMWQYCGTTQRVFKLVQQFLDERDYRLKKCSNIVLLEGLICEGMEEYGPCDRSCFFFWREEWLEKLT